MNIRLPLLLGLALASPCLAQDPSPAPASPDTLPPLPFKEESVGNLNPMPGVEITGLVVGTKITVDEAFAKEHENNPPSAPFVVTIPKGKGIDARAGGRKYGVPELLALGTKAPDGQAMEIIRFSSLRAPLEKDPADRLKLIAQLLVSKVLQSVTKGYDEARFLEAYATKVGGNDAVCVCAHMKKPESGEHYAVKLVAIPHPSQPGGVLAFWMADTARSEVKSPEDLASKGLGSEIIHSVRFLNP